jgi:hypothetical protein
LPTGCLAAVTDPLGTQDGTMDDVAGPAPLAWAPTNIVWRKANPHDGGLSAHVGGSRRHVGCCRIGPEAATGAQISPVNTTKLTKVLMFHVKH